ncbi:MAG: DUF4430 domain-containing protein [Candidatus Kerfeldbacteria bacterium]|nr:DUF4430 domain-containing protein [Candidatus Kerfeldbacteria bacterium]
MKKQSIVIVVIVVALVGVGAWWYTSQQTTPVANQNINPAATPNANVEAPLPTTISYQGQDGKTVLELLQENHEVVESNGFVQGIDGRVGSSTAYWLWYANGQEGQVGAKDYVTKSTETIEWRFVYAQ